ncbi:MAG: acyl-CoA dehydrogenase family protein, partial [Candidatus Binataceae bacterium]
MRREIFTEEHELFRTQVRRLVENEIAPKIPQWNRDGMSDRESWRKLGAAGFLGPNAPAEYGGGGVDFLFDAIVVEEMARVRAHGLMMALHSDVCMPYITSYGTEAQKHRYLPGACSGDLILAIGMTEPGTGSDLAAVKTNARRDGDSWVINGAKTFISNGQISDAVILVVKTDT